MTRAGRVVVLMAAGVISACGSDEGGKRQAQADAGTSAAAPAPAKGDATAEQVAAETRGKVKCPPKIRTAAPAANAPVDDIVGVRPGLTWDEAADIVLCTHGLMVVQADTSRRFNIQTYGQTIRQGFSARFAEPRVQKTSRQIMQEMQDEMLARSGNAIRQDMKPGQAKWYVSTMGMPGEERVIAAAREEWFEEGKNPPMASVEQALIKKYGTPNRTDHNGGRIYLNWAYDPMGRPITETSPLYHQCSGNSDPDGGTNFSPDCGVVVVAQVFQLRDNPDLSQYLQVGVIDQAGGYEAITGTEQRLQKLDAQRRAKEVEEAARNADTPQL